MGPFSNTLFTFQAPCHIFSTIRSYVCRRPSSKDKAAAATAMAEPPGFFTLDGQPPNGGVPPGRLFTGVPNAIEPLPVYSRVPVPVVGGQATVDRMYNVAPQNGWTHQCAPIYPALPPPQVRRQITLPTSIAASSPPESSASQLQLITQNKLLLPVPALNTPDNWGQQLVDALSSASGTVNIYYGTHQHIHQAAAAPPANAPAPWGTNNNNNNNDAEALPAPADVNAYIHFVNNGARPCDTYPDAFLAPFRWTPHVVPKTTTIQQLMTRLGCPRRGGFGLQQIFRTEVENVYGAGKHWEYGVGDQDMRLEECEIGRGIVGRETLLVAWRTGQ